jgi:mono/diheme cytochrome c family protein
VAACQGQQLIVSTALGRIAPQALEHEIEDGLNAMPSYADKLSEEDIVAVATYVEQRAELGWSRR